MAYLDHMRESRQTLCSSSHAASRRRLGSSTTDRGDREIIEEPALPASQSSVDCYTAPYVPVGFSNKASISLCRSRNLVLNSCAFFAGRRKGTLTKKFPMPARGAIQLACDMVNFTSVAEQHSDWQWLKSIQHDVWWGNTTRDDAAVGAACAPNSTNLVTTPTLFVMRDRHANYAHEMEVVSMAFSFLAALEPPDVAQDGVQVVIVDQAPPTGFLETWARISQPHRLRILAHDPFPPGTCFRSAYHVYTFAAGIGYNTNSETTRCESPVVTGLSHWLRQLYEEKDPALPMDLHPTASMTAAATAGPVAAAAGVRGLRPPTAGIIMRNVVWLSRRNLELVRLLLNASVGWKAMRMVRNEDEVVTALQAAVQEWNLETCLLQQFDRVVKSEYEKSLETVHAVHHGPKDTATKSGAGSARRRGAREKGLMRRSARNAAAAAEDAELQREVQVAGGEELEGVRARMRRRMMADGAGGGGDIDEHGNDGGDDDDDGDEQEREAVTAASSSGAAGNGTAQQQASPAATNRTGGGSRDGTTPSYMVGTNTILLDRLWEQDEAFQKCRRTNVLFTFLDGDFNDVPYHHQLKTMFRTGVLVGVHGAGLTHGFFLPPGQSAVLQLLGESFAKVAANNVFRNMAAGVGNFYEDVMYIGVDVKVDILKQAVKRAMDFVAKQVMEAQAKHSGGALPLVLDDQNHFNIVVPSLEQCPRNRSARAMTRRK